MIPFVVAFVEFVLATFIPLYLGMFLAGAVRTVRLREAGVLA